MPFVKKHLRKPLLKRTRKPEKPGELCFLEYYPMMDKWKKEKRWTTIHNIYRDLFYTSDAQTAKFLAFLEFYIRHGHKYEKKMSRENGDI